MFGFFRSSFVGETVSRGGSSSSFALVWIESVSSPNDFTNFFFFLDLMSVFHNFLEHEIFENSLNATLLLSSLKRLGNWKLGTLDLLAWWGVYIRSWQKFLLVDWILLGGFISNSRNAFIWWRHSRCGSYSQFVPRQQTEDF